MGRSVLQMTDRTERVVATGADLTVTAAFDLHSKAVYNYLLRMTASHQVAEDLTQETFERLLGAIANVRDADHARAWLFRTASNLAVSRQRRHRVWNRIRGLVGFRDEAVSVEADSAEAAEVQRALMQMPEGYRSVLVMHDVAGMTHEEIAEARGCAVGTAKSQLVRARARLAKLLGGDESSKSKEES